MALSNYQQTEFRGGEWSPFFQGRADHKSYKTAMNVCRNGFPMEEGAWVRRPGTRLKAPTYQGGAGRIYPVEFTENEPYDVEFTDGWMRFYQGHRLVFTTDGAQAVTAVSTANPAVVQLTSAVTWATDDEIYFAFDAAHPSGALPLRQRGILLTKVDTTHFSLRDALTGAPIDGLTLAMPSGATITASRVLRVATPYDNGSWANNRIVQNQDMGVVLNSDYPPQRLTITPGSTAGTADATLTEITYKDGPYLDPVTDSSNTDSVLYWTGGTYTGPPLWQSPMTVSQGEIVGVYMTQQHAHTVTPTYIYVTYTGYGVESGGSPFLGSTTTSDPSDASRDLFGWAPVDPAGVGAGVTGSISVTAGFRAWSSAIAYQADNYVNVSTTSYRAKQASQNVEPGVTVGWATYWEVVDSGIAVTGPGKTPVGFQSSDVGRLIRIFSDAPPWDPTAIYPNGAVVSYNGTIYAMTGASDGRFQPRAGINPENTFTAPQWGVIGEDQSNNSQTGTPDINGTTETLAPGWCPIGASGQWSWGRITAVTSTSQATVELDAESAPIVFPLGNPPLTTFRMGLWSDTTGFPSCGSFYEGRFWFGGSQPNRFDTSQTFGWEKGSSIVNMAPTFTSGNPFSGFVSDGTVTDACGISYTFESRDTNEIVWMEPDHNGLMCGTIGGEWLISASTLSDPITPTSIQAKRVTRYGCASIEPRRTGLSLVFVQKFKRRLMEFLPDVFSGRYTAPHLNEMAKHLSKNGIEEIAYQEELAPILWARTGNGS